MVKSQVSGKRAPCTLQCGEISVFDVIISMAGLLIPFNSSSEPGQGCQGGGLMNETRRNFSPRRPKSSVVADAADPSGRLSISPQIETAAISQNCTRHGWNHVSH